MWGFGPAVLVWGLANFNVSAEDPTVKCLVTGATGFIGSALCARLATLDIDAIALSGSGATLPSGQQTLQCDLNQSVETLEPLLEGVDVVCHLAAIAHQRASEEQYQRLNVEASLNLARAALNRGVDRFIFISSVKAMGVPASNGARNEAEVYPAPEAYGRSKWEAEEGLRDLCRDSGMSLVILRPALVYGPGVKGNLQLLIKGARLGMPRPPAAGARSMIGLGDLVALIAALVKQTPSGVHTWNVTDGQEYSARGLYDSIREAMDKPPGREWLSERGWRRACTVLDKLSGRQPDSTYEKLFGPECYSSSALQRDTGWVARQRFVDVVSSMVEAAEG